jgi:hypothetical protein
VVVCLRLGLVPVLLLNLSNSIASGSPGSWGIQILKFSTPKLHVGFMPYLSCNFLRMYVY